MPITKGCKQLVDEANQVVKTVATEDAIKMHGDPNVV